jgi:hypothetical protein
MGNALMKRGTMVDRVIKSFAGDSKGGGFSKEPPLAAGGKK